MKSDRDYEIGPGDRAWIEATSEPIHPALMAIEEAADPADIPILDRESGRVLAVLAASRRRIVEVGTAYGYSTLWMALAQGAGGSIVTIDPDRGRTDLARAFWRSAGIAVGRIAVVNAKALEAFGAGDPALAGPFDLAFIDALKGEYLAYLDALVPRLVTGALVVADNVLWSGRVPGTRPADPDDEGTTALRAFDAAVLRDRRFQSSILPVGDGLLVASYRG
jgi:predicted O-methyltransferase YrrM